MKTTSALLTLACLVALSGCSETTESSSKAAPKTTASSVGSTSASTEKRPIPAVVDTTPVVQTKPVSTAPVAMKPIEAPVAKAPAPAAPVEVTYDFPAKAPRNLTKRFIEKDVNKDGFLNLEEFTTYLAVWLAENQPAKDPVQAAPSPFYNKDTNGDGLLSPQEAF